eukprot:2995562-Prymnesium_polylepis.1
MVGCYSLLMFRETEVVDDTTNRKIKTCEDAKAQQHKSIAKRSSALGSRLARTFAPRRELLNPG